MGTHYWIRGDRRRDRDHTIAQLDLPPTLAVLDAHRRLRGPYTAAGTLLRSVAADALRRRPELGPRHNIEIVTAAPELVSAVPPAWATLEWAVGEGERTRYYSRLHTVNIANGLAEFLRDYLEALGGEPRTLVVENVHLADPTDQEFVAVLLRRHDIAPLTVVAGTGMDTIPDPPGESTLSLATALAAHTVCIDAPATAVPSPLGNGADRSALAQAFVDSDGTSDDPALIAAYEQLPDRARALLHDERAALLSRTGLMSLRNGAIPYHAECGTDPAGAGLAALKDAMQRCNGIGLYQAAADFGLRGRAIADRSTQPALWWDFTNSTSMALASLGRADEAKALYDEARAASTDPEMQMNLAYGIAMLYARHYPEHRRDYQQARAWMNMSIALATLLADGKKRAFHSVFGGNGLALVEVRQKKMTEALRLLEEGMARLDRELAPGEHALHRIVLRYNRAQLFGMMGRLDEALTDYAAVVEVDPDFPEHHFNIGNILRRLGRNGEAINAYERALSLSPPFPEAYYNRGDARLELGDISGALVDFGYAIELDPEHVDARVNRAALLVDRGATDAAWRDVLAGLALAPGHPHLLCLRGQLRAERGEIAAGLADLDAAVDAAPSLPSAWAIRGVLAFEAGRIDAALSDFTEALRLADDPAVRFNRGIALQQTGRWADAAADFDAVLAEVDEPEARERRALCRRQASAAETRTPSPRGQELPAAR